MTTKVTLTIEADIIESAKKYAAKSGQSLSKIVEGYFKSLSVNKDESKNKYSPAIRELLGSVPLPKDFDYKKELANELTKQYRD
jgi:hypothetical protein